MGLTLLMNIYPKLGTFQEVSSLLFIIIKENILLYFVKNGPLGQFNANARLRIQLMYHVHA